MEIDKKNNDPDYKCAAYESMADAWKLTQAFYKGEDEVKRQGFLKKFDGEPDFENRKDEAELFEVFASQVKSVAGIITGREIAPVEPPKVIADLLPDIDCCGNDFHSFVRDTLISAIRDGHSFILVDAPPPPEKPEGRELTGADVAGRRPWWINYEASQAVNWATETNGGRVELTRITFKENSTESDGSDFGEKQVTRYRVFKLIGGEVYFSLYKLKDDKKATDKERFEIEAKDEPTGLKQIPVICVYARIEGFLKSVPPFVGVARGNKKHFNKLSMLDYVHSFIKPKVVIKHDTKKDAEDFQKLNSNITSGANIWGENAEIYYLELKGDSIPQLRLEIEAIENRMAKMGLEKFAPQQDGSQKTAFEIASDNKKEMSEIEIIARNFENAIETAFDFTIMQLQNIFSETSVAVSDEEKTQFKLNIDFNKLTFNLDQIRLLDELVEKGRLSDETFWEIVQPSLDMPKDWDFETEMKRIARTFGMRSKQSKIDDTVVEPSDDQ